MSPPSIECKVGKIYQLKSRNLNLGVFTSKNTFIGIRQKFGDRFLDEELHRDCGGTALPLKEIAQCPHGITLKSHLGSYDRITGADVMFDRPTSDGGKGWYFVSTGMADREIRPVAKNNIELFDLLNELELEYKENYDAL